jgi:hypothetical protein
MTPWCRKLRWKTFREDEGDPARVLAAFNHGHCVFTCVRTAQCVGEDGNLAAPEACNGSRACFEPHPLAAALVV